MRSCPSCRALVSASLTGCPACGKPLAVRGSAAEGTAEDLYSQPSRASSALQLPSLSQTLKPLVPQSSPVPVTPQTLQTPIPIATAGHTTPHPATAAHVLPIDQMGTKTHVFPIGEDLPNRVASRPGPRGSIPSTSPSPVDVLADAVRKNASGTAIDDTRWCTGEPVERETTARETVQSPKPAEETEAVSNEALRQLSASASVRADVSRLPETPGSDQVHTTKVPAAPPGVSPFKKTVIGIGVPHGPGDTKSTSRAAMAPKQPAQGNPDACVSVRSAGPPPRDAKDRATPNNPVHDDTRESSSQGNTETARFVYESTPRSASRAPGRRDAADKRRLDRPGHERLSNIDEDWPPLSETRAQSSERTRLTSSPSLDPRSNRVWALRLAVVGLLVVAVIVAIATVALVVWSDSPTISSQVIVDDHGNDVLLLTCESCANDTVLSIGQDRAHVHNKMARLVLSRPLEVGQNLLQVRLNHVPSGRNESVPLRIPVAFRVRPSLEGLDNPKPTIRIEVQTKPNTRVELDNQPVPIASLNAEKGLGYFDWDITHLCTGPTSTVTTIEKSFEYAIRPQTGDVVRGSVPVKVTVVPLVIYSPPAPIEVETDSFQLTGWTLPGARVSVENAVIGLSHDGNFTQRLRLLRMGLTTIHVRAQQPGHAQRTVSITVRRVPALRQAAHAWETEELVELSGLFKDASPYRGKKVILDGQVTDVVSRLSHKFITLTVANVAKVCAPKPCLARVEYGGELTIQKDDKVRVFAYVDDMSPLDPAAKDTGTTDIAAKDKGDPANMDSTVKVSAAFILPAAMVSTGD